MEKKLKILFVEDSPTDLELVQRALKKGEIAFTESVAVNQDEFEKALADFEPNIIISDYNLPRFNGMQALQLRNQKMPMVPFILVTGSNNEEIAVECMKAGADDYILKDNLTRLCQAAHAALTKYNYLKEKKVAEDELIRAKEKAEESDRLKTAFLQNISHEIRTPLNAIIGFSTLMGNEGLQADKKKEYLDVINTSNEQLLSIISGIIALSTLETGQDKIMEERTHVNGLLGDIYDQFHASIKDKRIDFSYHSALPDDRAYIITDPLKLKQILINLVGNALKFTPNGSVKFGYRISQEKIEFLVEDTGIGIPEEMHEKIFERFRQADDSTTRHYGGTGLGLALSKGYAELMGGTISLQSEPGKGSLFTVTLPYKQPIEESEPVDLKIREVAPGKEKSRTILVAEDDDINYMLLEEMLRGEEIVLIRARNGVEAVDHCKNNSRIDLVLMDIKMPIMNGIEATLQIKNLRPDLPVIAQTAYANESDKDEIIAVGFDDYLGKPLKFYDVIQKIYYRL